MNAIPEPSRRGGPLTMLALLMLVWVGARAFTWENPFPHGAILPPGSELIFADKNEPANEALAQAIPWTGSVQARGRMVDRAAAQYFATAGKVPKGPASPQKMPISPQVQYGHHLLWLRALGAKLVPGEEGGPQQYAVAEPETMRLAGVTPIAPSFEEEESPGRWSFDTWAFWREGSNSAPISQGRVPIYGASQLGANLQFRIAPSTGLDPRLFVRAYRALVTNGESELAFGASARPVTALPVRVAGELRVTDRRFGTDLRPAVLATTELPPQELPVGFRLEAYGGAGYVGGKGATAFVDGQAAVTREVVRFGGASNEAVRFSLGAATWGGAQEDASRVDVGPTMRLDLTIGKVPARVSVDWRERVGGDAAPNSGLAATLSSRF